MNGIKNILILGASGFIGNEILQEFAKNGNYSIMAMQNKKPIEIPSPNVRVIHQNLSSLKIEKLPLVPDVIIHAARMRTGKFGKIGRRWMARKGRRANEKLLSQIKKMKNKPRVIYLSGSLMYGSIPEYLIHENFPLSPISFAREYVAAEKPFIKELEAKQSNMLMLRLPWVIGAGSWLEWSYLRFIEDHNKIPLYGNGNNIMTFIDVRNLAESVVKLCQIPHSGLLHLFNQEYFTQRNFSELMAKIFKKEVQCIDIGEKSKINTAIKEAFNSDIQLGSNYKDIQTVLQKDMFSIEESLSHFGLDLFRKNGKANNSS